ncbi:hypothetical protein GCM10027346_20400 [Hymenobacter seoulensis]
MAAAGQTSQQRRLKRELDSLDVADQHYRQLLMGGTRPRYESVASLNWMMIATDSVHIRRVAELIARYGYPGRTLVGAPTNEVALLVIQHSGRIPQYLPLIRRMAELGEVPYSLYARMLDRYLAYQGKPQRYGTQGRGYLVRNACTGRPEQVSFIWPIEDAALVNQRRKKAGFDSTVEENALRLGIPYRPITLAEAQRLERASKDLR